MFQNVPPPVLSVSILKISPKLHKLEYQYIRIFNLLKHKTKIKYITHVYTLYCSCAYVQWMPCGMRGFFDTAQTNVQPEKSRAVQTPLVAVFRNSHSVAFENTENCSIWMCMQASRVGTSPCADVPSTGPDLGRGSRSDQSKVFLQRNPLRIRREQRSQCRVQSGCSVDSMCLSTHSFAPTRLRY